VAGSAFAVPDLVVSATLFSPTSFPTLQSLFLSEEEKNLVTRLMATVDRQQAGMRLTNAYYEGEQTLTNLGIAIPKELESLRTVIGWPALAVDPIAERLSIDGFRLPGRTSTDDSLWELWSGNDMPAQFAMGTIDALAMRSSWVTVGSNPDGGMPIMRVESPLNMAAVWDGRTMSLAAVLQRYYEEENAQAVLYLPGQSLYLATDANGNWQLVRRDRHGGPIPVERIVNRPRTHDLDGRSEITPFVMQWTDAACRTLLQMQVAGEFYSVPQRYILGVTEEDFKDSNGNTKTAWESYITKYLALERDDDGELPVVGQFPAYDPSVFTRVLDFYASKLAGPLRATPQDFGIYTEGNPPSADAVQFTEGRRDRYAVRKQEQHGPGWVRALQHAVRIDNGGNLPKNLARIDVDWAPPTEPSMTARGTYIQQLVTSEVLPPQADVTRQIAGLTAIQRAQLRQEEQEHAGRATLQQIGDRFLSGNAQQADASSSGD
jgi:hypothetical protein